MLFNSGGKYLGEIISYGDSGWRRPFVIVVTRRRGGTRGTFRLDLEPNDVIVCPD